MHSFDSPITDQPERLRNLRDLREQVAALKAVKCHLYHEKVRYDSETSLPVAHPISGGGYIRVGFCSPDLRRQRISCGHTMSRYLLRDAITALSRIAPEAGGYDELMADLERTGLEIYQFDIAKGEAEWRKTDLLLDLERRRRQGEETGEVLAGLHGIEEEIAAIEAGHGLRADHIGELQRIILARMDAVIEGEMG